MTLKTIVSAIALSLIMGLAFPSCHSTKKVVTGDKGKVETSKKKKPRTRRLKVTDDISYDDDFVPSTKSPVMWVDDGTIDPVIINRVLAEAKTWLGTRYVYGGNTRYGIDCSGFVKNVYQNALGINISRTATLQQHECTLLKRSELEPGDLIFFATVKGPGVIAHVGMYVGDGMMIHASSRRGVIYSPVDGGYYLEKWHSAGRLNKVIEKNDRLAKQFKKEAKTGKPTTATPAVAPKKTADAKPVETKKAEVKPENKPSETTKPKTAATTASDDKPKVASAASADKPKAVTATQAAAAASAAKPEKKEQSQEQKPSPAVETKASQPKTEQKQEPSILDLLIKEKTDSIYKRTTPTTKR